jgi:hypothetical protein
MSFPEFFSVYNEKIIRNINVVIFQGPKQIVKPTYNPGLITLIIFYFNFTVT